MADEITYWNGFRNSAVRGTAEVALMEGWWCEDLAGQRIAVVYIQLDEAIYGDPKYLYNDGVYILDNRDGGGWSKVTDIEDSRDMNFTSVPIVEGSFQPDA